MPHNNVFTTRAHNQEKPLFLYLRSVLLPLHSSKSKWIIRRFGGGGDVDGGGGGVGFHCRWHTTVVLRRVRTKFRIRDWIDGWRDGWMLIQFRTSEVRWAIFGKYHTSGIPVYWLVKSFYRYDNPKLEWASFYMIYIISDLSRAYTGQVKSGITLIFTTVDSKWSILASQHEGSWPFLPVEHFQAVPACTGTQVFYRWYSKSILPVFTGVPQYKLPTLFLVSYWESWSNSHILCHMLLLDWFYNLNSQR